MTDINLCDVSVNDSQGSGSTVPRGQASWTCGYKRKRCIQTTMCSGSHLLQA
ncbi:hypothetical protein I79_025801 [Cricetulus griseus]|uniref:Uncharacterized protein n=1 Tax=Cricetulus griseus TaxID=10029 RepID=G3IP96_CRIGR|nr:hypothetical protein I79_025801 [Cricetulus griseus]